MIKEPDMTTVHANVPTANGGRYVRQLGSHWAHKLPVSFDGDRATITFPEAVTSLDPGPDAITVSISGEDPATVERLKDVVARHLDRFAFREAPLTYEWN
jgi:hypothetical protein